MARLARIILPGYPHHITQRGVRSMDIFFSDEDRLEYLHLLKEQSKRFGLRFISYCLMNNHVHFVVIPEEESSLSRGIGEAHRRYTKKINFRQKTKGYLFQGRFFSCPLDEKYLYSAVRYVERNPVGVIKGITQAWEYAWSSARYHVGLADTDCLIDKNSTILDMDKSDWKSLLSKPSDDDDYLIMKTKTGRPCGDEHFIEKAEKLTNRVLKPKKRGPKSSKE